MVREEHEHIFEIVREIGPFVKKKCKCGKVKFFLIKGGEDA